MEEHRRPPRERLDGTPAQIARAHQIVAEELGDDFCLEYTHFKNVGIHGDTGVYGDTVFVCGRSRAATIRLLSDDELMERVSVRICNEAWAVTRVLVDLTTLSNSEAREPSD